MCYSHEEVQNLASDYDFTYYDLFLFFSGVVPMVGVLAKVRKGGAVVVGRQLTSHSPGTMTDSSPRNMRHSLRGSVAHLTILTNQLSTLDVNSYIDSCSSAFNLEWEKVKAVEDSEDHCRKQDMFIFVPSKHTRLRSRDICQSFGGAPVYPRTSEQRKALRAKFAPFVSECTTSYGSWVWVDAHLTYFKTAQHTATGQWHLQRRFPASPRDQCLSLGLDASSPWVPTPCHEKLCTICHAISRPVFTLRGGCRFPKDRQLTFLYDSSDSPSLQSVYGIKIVWDKQNWIIKSHDDSKTLASQLEISGSPVFPLGLKKWQFSDEMLDCPRETELLLSVCNEHNFACTDGLTCVPWGHRCNLQMDCADGSDEEGCQIRANFTPTTPNLPPPASSSMAMTVSVVSVIIKKLDFHISRLVAEVTLCFGWYDARLILYNLRPGVNRLADTLRLWRVRVGALEAIDEAPPSSVTVEYNTTSAGVTSATATGDLFTQGQELK